MRRGIAAFVLAGMLAGCQPATTRPPYPAVAQAATAEIRLPPREVTQRLAEALRAESILATRIVPRDAWFETQWFDPATGQRTKHRPIGAGAVLLRAWADPTQPGSSKVTVETVYRPMADASLPERELDRQVPRDHPVAIKVRAALQDLVKRYGGPPPPAAVRPPAEPSEQPAQQDQSGEDEGASPPEETPPPDQSAP
jgi:hypothetical protein